jgi:lipopolysaccharide transport system permease protein
MTSAGRDPAKPLMKILTATDVNGLSLPPRSAPASSTLARDVIYYRDLILVLLAKEFKVRYKSTFMGYAWSVVNPLAYALVFFMLFRVVMRFEMRAYPLFLIAGLFQWQWIANTLASANFFFLGNRTLIKKVRFHRATLVLAGALNEMAHFVVSLPVILAFMLYYRQPITLDWLWALPAVMLIQFVMLLGLALLVATSNLFFRDLERLTTVVMHLAFYLTPVLYQADRLPPEYRWLTWANPFAGLAMSWQGLFYDGSVAVEPVLVAAAWALVWLALGCWVYQRTVWRFAEIV